ncbi:hypothetical protein AWH04_25920 [Rhodococcus erythropolis]|nr:hypothetical protein AWH04_25920 [Rhodococcus erythropolis]
MPTAQSPGGGPNVGANAPTNFPTYNGTPIVTVPSVPGSLPSTSSPGVQREDNSRPLDEASVDVLDDTEKSSQVTAESTSPAAPSIIGPVPVPGLVRPVDREYKSDRIDAYDDLGPNEQAACDSNYFYCFNVSRRGADSVPWDESEKYFPDSEGYNGVDDRRDAARHCIWMGMMTAWSTETYARTFADAHETDSPSAPSDPAYSQASRDMDFYNNETGIAVGLRHDDDTAGIINECVTRARAATKIPMTGVPSPSSNTDGNALLYFNGP